MNDKPTDEQLNKIIHEAMGLGECTCSTECDCENEPAGLLSNECPIHNTFPFPVPAPDCPLHSNEPDFDIPDYCNDLNAAAVAERFTIEKVGDEKYGEALIKVAHQSVATKWSVQSFIATSFAGYATLNARQRIEACLKALGKEMEG